MIKVRKKSQNSRNPGFLKLFLLDERRIRIRIHTSDLGSGSRRPKNIRIRIRIRNTAEEFVYERRPVSFASCFWCKTLNMSDTETMQYVVRDAWFYWSYCAEWLKSESSRELKELERIRLSIQQTRLLQAGLRTANSDQIRTSYSLIKSTCTQPFCVVL
jgi:hypothetical protein